MDDNEGFRADEELQLTLFWKAPERRTNEDRLLLKYWREVGGVIFTEMPILRHGPREWPLGEIRYGPPQWPPGAKKRRIDGVRLLAPPPGFSGLSDGIYWFVRDGGHLIASFIAGARVEVIELKQELNDEVLGQVIANADLLEMEYEPAQVDPVVVCEVGDPALEAACERRGVAVFVRAAE
jgi:hypothetical protein